MTREMKRVMLTIKIQVTAPERCYWFWEVLKLLDLSSWHLVDKELKIDASKLILCKLVLLKVRIHF